MKIVIFVSYTYPFIGSGIGQVALMQAEGLAHLGHEVTLVSGNIPKVKKKEFRKKSVVHIKLDCINLLSKLSVPVPIFLFNKKVLSLIKEADIVHSHDNLYPNTLQAAIWSKLFRKKFVLTQHIGFVKYPNPLVNIIEKIAFNTVGAFVLKLSDKTILINESLKDFIHADKNKLKYLINGVDTQLFHPAGRKLKAALRVKYKLPKNKKIVLFVGRFVPKKGVDILLAAADKNYLILLAGDGKLPDNLTYNRNYVRVIGNLSQKSLSEYYKLSDLFVLPSRDEGLPLSIQEAVASGIPVITTRLPGYKKYFRGAAIKFVDSEPKVLHSAILTMFKNNTFFDKAKLSATGGLIQAMSWSHNVSELFETYKSLLK